MPEPRLPAAEKIAALELLDLDIVKLVAGGDGIGFVDGIPVFVPRSAPGDRLTVRISRRYSGYARADIVDVLKPGPGRIEPRCQHFAACGGCDLQHLEYEAQVRAKVEAAVETLRRIGGIKLPDNSRIVRGDAWHYRLRTTLHRDLAVEDSPEPGETQPEEPAAHPDLTTGHEPVGYLAAGSHDLVPVEECPILAPELEAVVKGLPESLAAQPGKRLDLAVGDEGRVTHAPPGPDQPGGAVQVVVGGFTYQFDARCFFQTHRGLLDDLVKTVMGDEVSAKEGRVAVDLYSGVGLFSLPLARRYEKVLAVESDRIATRYLKANARRNDLDNVQVETQAVETWMPRLPACDRLIVDPPRAGLSPYMRSIINRVEVPWLTYVSCHPAALARDLAALKHYEIGEIVFLDLFPQTGHLEMVVQLRRSG